MATRISELSRKLLWSRSAGRCAYPNCRKELVPLYPGTNKAANTGDEAHIVGESRAAARGVSTLSDKERADFSNLILLCPNHHRRIDNKLFKKDYNVARLHEMKTRHELWVQQSLSDRSALSEVDGRVYGMLIDRAVTKCNLDGWTIWSENAATARPHWRRSHISDILEFRDDVFAAVFSNTLLELQAALSRFAHVIAGAALALESQSDDTENGWVRDRQFYREERCYKFVETRESIRELYDRWITDYYSRVHDTMAAANWLADVVRRDVNPMFFALHGKFWLHEELRGERHTVIREYSQEERAMFTNNPTFGFAYAASIETEMRAIAKRENRLNKEVKSRLN